MGAAIGAGGCVRNSSPLAAMQQPNSRAFELGGAPSAVIPPSESVPLVGQTPTHRLPFTHLQPSALWASGFPLVSLPG